MMSFLQAILVNEEIFPEKGVFMRFFKNNALKTRLFVVFLVKKSIYLYIEYGNNSF